MGCLQLIEYQIQVIDSVHQRHSPVRGSVRIVVPYFDIRTVGRLGDEIRFYLHGIAGRRYAVTQIDSLVSLHLVTCLLDSVFQQRDKRRPANWSKSVINFVFRRGVSQ